VRRKYEPAWQIALSMWESSREVWWFLVRGMNFGHSGLTGCGFTGDEIPETATVLDIGCGGGRTLERLASLARHGKAVGIEHSKDSIAVAQKRNQRLIADGRVEVIHGSVSSMPFLDATFDCLSAVETYYFWPDIAVDLAEVRRVMKPRGQLVIIAGMYRGSSFDKLNARVIRAGGINMKRCQVSHCSTLGVRWLISEE
jgi:SAM-dependent methyltransferase